MIFVRLNSSCGLNFVANWKMYSISSWIFVHFCCFQLMFSTEIYNSLPMEKTFFHAHTRGNYNFFCQTALWLLIFVWTYCQWSMQWCLPSAATPPLLDMSPVSGPPAQSVMLIQLWSFLMCPKPCNQRLQTAHSGQLECIGWNLYISNVCMPWNGVLHFILKWNKFIAIFCKESYKVKPKEIKTKIFSRGWAKKSRRGLIPK